MKFATYNYQRHETVGLVEPNAGLIWPLAAMLGVIGATRGLPATPPSDLVKALKRAGDTISSALGYTTERDQIRLGGKQR